MVLNQIFLVRKFANGIKSSFTISSTPFFLSIWIRVWRSDEDNLVAKRLDLNVQSMQIWRNVPNFEKVTEFYPFSSQSYKISYLDVAFNYSVKTLVHLIVIAKKNISYTCIRLSANLFLFSFTLAFFNINVKGSIFVGVTKIFLITTF